EEGSERGGETHATSDRVRGQACPARPPFSLATASSTATARRGSDRTQSTRTRIRPAASETTSSGSAISRTNARATGSVIVVVDVGDRRGGCLFTDAFAGLRHHLGDLQPPRLGRLLRLP